MLDLGRERVTLPTVCAWPLARACSPVVDFFGEVAPARVEPRFRLSRRDEARRALRVRGLPQVSLRWLVASTEGRNRALKSSAERFEYAASRESDGSSKSSGSSLIM